MNPSPYIMYPIAVVLGVVLGIILMFLCTPLLWRLEDVVPLELAGHSGPADWVLVAGGIGGACLNVFVFWRLRK